MILNGLPWKRTEITVILEIAPKYCISDSLLTMREHNPQLWKRLVVKVKSDALKNNNCIGTWDVRSMNQGELVMIKQEMARLSIGILGISE